jgi:hypothetical protein
MRVDSLRNPTSAIPINPANPAMNRAQVAFRKGFEFGPTEPFLNLASSFCANAELSGVRVAQAR